MATGVDRPLCRIDVESERDVWSSIREGARMARDLDMTEADCVRVETVISELAHNIFLHGGGGIISLSQIGEDTRHGLRIRAQDSGPGIRCIGQALQDGYTTGDSLGIGLGIIRRMMDDVAIRSHPGWGTVITVTKWAT